MFSQGPLNQMEGIGMKLLLNFTLAFENHLSYTLISLKAVEVGINVDGVQSCKINECGGWNKPEGWDLLETTSI